MKNILGTNWLKCLPIFFNIYNPFIFQQEIVRKLHFDSLFLLSTSIVQKTIKQRQNNKQNLNYR